ncbi:hypothetical protein OPT61_g5430 [Boeremia exigua]|uniref:Uncharacterized protein n=1 Tax=Boeremia exigua TaxID=749465 RepID=A0ACC2IAG8_9PLEO|nr:hypothetical protein OPT61_g5430 [Boeremia exigua]
MRSHSELHIRDLDRSDPVANGLMNHFRREALVRMRVSGTQVVPEIPREFGRHWYASAWPSYEAAAVLRSSVASEVQFTPGTGLTRLGAPMESSRHHATREASPHLDIRGVESNRDIDLILIQPGRLPSVISHGSGSPVRPWAPCTQKRASFPAAEPAMHSTNTESISVPAVDSDGCVVREASTEALAQAVQWSSWDNV